MTKQKKYEQKGGWMDLLATLTGAKIIEGMLQPKIRSPIPDDSNTVIFNRDQPYKNTDPLVPAEVTPKTVQAEEPIKKVAEPTPTMEPLSSGETDVSNRITKELKKQGMYSPEVLAYALATVKHETANSFKPVREGYYNDEKYGYEPGFTGKSEARKRNYSGGENYYGRGYIQLTHDYNYKNLGDKLGIKDLSKNPDEALDPDVATKILVQYFKDRGTAKLAYDKKFNEARGTINADSNADLVTKYALDYLKRIKK